MNKNVCVLLSSYNGAKYIKEQLDSILNQDISTITVLVRDDGSKDGTTDTLHKYQEEGRITILKSSKNVGPAVSFMELLYQSPEADYYAFSDQDDIWRSDKLSRALTMMSEKDLPSLYASNQMIFQDGEEKGFRFDSDPNYTLTGIICGNHLSGCTMVLNKKLRDILVNEHNRPDENVLRLRMHDTWIAAVAAGCGEIIYDPEPHILYRIHDNNTVGVDNGKVRKRILRAIRKLKKSDQRYGRTRFCIELLKINELDQSSKQIISRFANSKKDRNALLRDTDIKRDCPESRLIFILKSLLGWQ